MKTRIFRSIKEWQAFRRETKSSLGFVPTMGALHDGHASLIRKSAEQNDFTLASIFVNPTQFNDPKDLANYPKTFEQDLAVLEQSGADFLLYPEFEEIYADQYRFQLSENDVSKTLCGAHRPGHFTGVLTVVMKLLQIAQADRAYFGEKDFQQYVLIRDMARAFFLPTEIVSCPLIREEDGLAMSSRNVRLSKTEREKAPGFHRALKEALSTASALQLLRDQGFEVDYVEEKWGRRLGAVQLGKTRLIDNVEI